MGERPGGGMGDAGCVGAVLGTLPASRIPPPDSTSSRFVGITGSSATFPLSNNCRHSSPTEAGSRRYCSYMTCTNAALCVPKTNSLTAAIRSEEHTSELQSRLHLVCRLLLEKKKQPPSPTPP